MAPAPITTTSTRSTGRTYPGAFALDAPRERVFDGRGSRPGGASMGMMRVLDHTGDTVVEWRADDPESVEVARAAFDGEQRRHRICFARRAGQTAAQVKPLLQFDPTVEEMIWVRPVTAG